MKPVPFGISEYTTWPLTFEQDVELYLSAGVSYIEVCEAKLDMANPAAQLRRLADSGLKVSSVQPRIHSLFPDAPRPEPTLPRDRMIRLKESIKLFGRYFPGVTLVTISGAAPQGDYDCAYRTAEKEYRELAHVAADHGVRVALEPLHPVLMNIDTFICSLPQAARIVESVDHPCFGLFVDVWHIWDDAAAAARIRQYGDRIFGIHVNDWRTPRAFGDRFLPGNGDMPLVELLKAVRATPYQGAYTLEVFSELHLDGSLWADPKRTVLEGKRAFEDVWSRVCA